MTPASHETQVALLTAPGRSALATILLFGPRAQEIVAGLFRPIARRSPMPNDPGPHYGHLGIDPVDDVILTWRANDHLPAVEIHCHGGPAMVDGLLRQLERGGACPVDWRAALQSLGKSEIALEATEALARAFTQKTARLLFDQASSLLENAWQKLAGPDGPAVARELLTWHEFGQHLVEPWRVQILGRPNVGKSSLLNAILGHGRAIVSDQPGTTRDLVEALAAIQGWPVLFIDSAGLRETSDPLERAGIERAQQALAAADLKLFVIAAPYGLTAEDTELIEQLAPDLIVMTKSDLGTSDKVEENVSCVVSARTGAGMDGLLERIARELVPTEPPPGTPVPFTLRQRRLLERLALTEA